MGRPKTLGGCMVPGCSRAAISKGLCGLHYQRARRGIPLDRAEGPNAKPEILRPCAVSGCDDVSTRRVSGLCLFHYQRNRHGVALEQPRQPHRARPVGAAARGGPCGVEGCQIPAAAMGLCWGHYRSQLRGKGLGGPKVKPEGAKYARALREGPKNANYRVRRMALFEWYLREGLVTPEPNTGCLLWLGNYHPVSGYPVLGHAQNLEQRDPWGQYGHRAALHFSGVKLETGNRKLHARHLCNNPGCVAAAFNAPVSAHVVYGTAKENMADRTARYARGEIERPRPSLGPRKLSPSLIAYCVEAHARGASYVELGDDLGVHYNTVRFAVCWATGTHNQNTSQAA